MSLTPQLFTGILTQPAALISRGSLSWTKRSLLLKWETPCHPCLCPATWFFLFHCPVAARTRFCADVDSLQQQKTEQEGKRLERHTINLIVSDGSVIWISKLHSKSWGTQSQGFVAAGERARALCFGGSGRSLSHFHPWCTDILWDWTSGCHGKQWEKSQLCSNWSVSSLASVRLRCLRWYLFKAKKSVRSASN